MRIDWNFPSNGFGIINGISEAGIETFTGSPYPSLAREICQNSLDARLNSEEPVRVEFSSFNITPDSFPGYDNLKRAMEASSDFWKNGSDKKTIRFFNKALKVINQSSIPALRISDFNTKGLTGSDQSFGSPWQNLVKASGVSDKSGSSGGSFGIGKSAPFACSDLRTVFYSTKDIDNLEASQGVARLVSFPLNKETEEISVGTGYYGYIEKNQAIPKYTSLDPNFNRAESGTDVFILGFKNKTDWEEEVIAALLDDFLLSIYNGKLEVKVGETLINKQKLPQIIKKFQDTKGKAYNYYQVLTSEQTQVYETDFEGLGTIELRLLIQNGLHRKVLMSRGNGMKVFDNTRYPRQIQFAGICVLKDEKVNAYFREMENPQHNKWEAQRHSNPKEAEKRRKALNKYIRDTVNELGQSTILEEVDAEGIGEFLPDIDLDKNLEGEERKETIIDSIKQIDLSKKKLSNTQQGFGGTLDFNTLSPGDLDESLEEPESIEVDNSEDLFTDKNEFDKSKSKKRNSKKRSNWDDFPKEIKKPVSTRPEKLRLFIKDPENKIYRLIFRSGIKAKNGFIKLKLSGEQGADKVNAVEAEDTLISQKLKIQNGLIQLNDVERHQERVIDFRVDYKDASSMEVGIYGYKE